MCVSMWPLSMYVGTPEPEHLAPCVANVPQSPSGPDTYLIHSHPNKLRSPDNR